LPLRPRGQPPGGDADVVDHRFDDRHPLVDHHPPDALEPIEWDIERCRLDLEVVAGQRSAVLG